MTDQASRDTKTRSSKKKHIWLWGILCVIALMCLMLIAGRSWIKTATGHTFIEKQVNSRSFGPVERINISGLEGDVLKAFSIQELEIYDQDGLWLSAQDITMSWSPLKLLKRHVDVEYVSAAGLNVLRQPTLNPAPPGNDVSKPYTLSSPNMTVRHVDLPEALMGTAAQFYVTGGAVVTSRQKKATLNVSQKDIDGDSLNLDIVQDESGTISGDFNISGIAGGPLASILKAPVGSAILGEGRVGGTFARGAGNLDLSIGEALDSQSRLTWDEDTLALRSTSALTQWPALDTIITAVGNDIALEARFERKTRAFSANVTANAISMQTDGILTEGSFKPLSAALTLSAENPNALNLLPDGYSIGTTQISGRLDLSGSAGFEGRIAAQNLRSPYGQATLITGPLNVRKTNQDTLSLRADVAGKDVKLSQDIPLDLGSNMQLQIISQYKIATKNLILTSAELLSEQTSLSAKGTIGTSPLTLAIKGNLKSKFLTGGNVPDAIPGGALSANYSILKTADSGFAISTDGSYSPHTRSSEPFGTLLGEYLNFETVMSPVPGGIAIQTASIKAQELSIAASGQITDRFNIAIEGETRAPFLLNSIQIGERASLTGKITGARENPNVKLQAELSKLTASGRTLTDITMKADIIQLLDAPEGVAEIAAQSDYGPLLASAQLSYANGETDANELSVNLGDLTVLGDIRYLQSGLLEGELSLDLPDNNSRFAKGSLKLSPQDGQTQGVSLSAKAQRIAYKGYAIDELNARLSGTLSALTGEFSLQGQRKDGVLSDPITLNTPITLSKTTAQNYTLTLEPEGRFAQYIFKSAKPLRAGYRSGNISVDAPLLLRDRPFTIDYERNINGNESLNISAENMPVSLLPLPATLAETRGQWSAGLNLNSENQRATGGFRFKLSDWRGLGRAAGDGLDLDVEAVLDQGTANLEIDGQSESGFEITGAGTLPVASQGGLAGLRPQMETPLSGQLNAGGPAEAILNLITTAEAEIAGTLTANLNLKGTAGAPQVQGQASGSALAFEAIQIGTQLRSGEFQANFSNDSLSVPRIYFEDRQGGTLMGSGAFKLGEFGRPVGDIVLNAKKLKIIDRSDYVGTASGKIEYESKIKSAAVTGALVLDEVQIRTFGNSAAGVITIDVEEINAPPRPKTPVKDARKAIPTSLGVTIKAPRKIFVRSRGLDAELSLDAMISGTLDDIALEGRAEVVRGNYKLAGKTINIDTGSVIFNGPVSEARVSFEAAVDTTNITAAVTVSGTVRNPLIELSSTPARPEDEILSAILFGRSATQLSALEAAQLAATLAQISGRGGGLDLLGGLRDSLGIAQLGVSFDENGSTQVTGGRYLADNVYLQIFSGANSGQTGAVIDWELRKDLSLRSKIQADNDQSFSMSYKKDF